MCCRNNIAVSSLTAATMAKATVGFNDLECRPSESKIWSAAHRIRRFRVPTVRFLLGQHELQLCFVSLCEDIRMFDMRMKRHHRLGPKPPSLIA